MRRIFGLAGGLLLAWMLLVPAVIAADPNLPHTGRVLVSVGGDIVLPAGEQADAVVVVNGNAVIKGTVNTLVVVDGSALLSGATAETIVAVRAPVTLGQDTVVRGDVMTFDFPVTRVGNAQVGGDVRNVAGELFGLGFFIGPLVLLWLLGVALISLVAALLLAAIGARQVRAAEALVVREPVGVVVAGLLGIFLPILIAIPLFVSVVGGPLALTMLLFLWPLTAFIGYLVAAIGIGDWMLGRLTPTVVRERPYLAAVLGVIVLEVLSVFPPFVMIASFFGFGAVLMAAWASLPVRSALDRHSWLQPVGPDHPDAAGTDADRRLITVLPQGALIAPGRPAPAFRLRFGAHALGRRDAGPQTAGAAP